MGCQNGPPAETLLRTVSLAADHKSSVCRQEREKLPQKTTRAIPHRSGTRAGIHQAGGRLPCDVLQPRQAARAATGSTGHSTQQSATRPEASPCESAGSAAASIRDSGQRRAPVDQPREQSAVNRSFLVRVLSGEPLRTSKKLVNTPRQEPCPWRFSYLRATPSVVRTG